MPKILEFNPESYPGEQPYDLAVIAELEGAHNHLLQARTSVNRTETGIIDGYDELVGRLQQAETAAADHPAFTFPELAWRIRDAHYFLEGRSVGESKARPTEFLDMSEGDVAFFVARSPKEDLAAVYDTVAHFGGNRARTAASIAISNLRGKGILTTREMDEVMYQPHNAHDLYKRRMDWMIYLMRYETQFDEDNPQKRIVRDMKVEVSKLVATMQNRPLE
jgi:hypothetical protein